MPLPITPWGKPRGFFLEHHMYHSIFQTMDDIRTWGTTYAIYKAVRARGLFKGLYQVFVASKMIKHADRLRLL